MRLLFIDNAGGGIADGIDAAEGTTVARLFAGQMPGREAADHPTRVNPSPAVAEQVLQPDDRISFPPDQERLATRLQAAWAARDEPPHELGRPPRVFDGCLAGTAV